MFSGGSLSGGLGERIYTSKNAFQNIIRYDEVIVEIRAISGLSGTEETQIINYLKAAGLELGLLINFGSKLLEHKRFVYNYIILELCGRKHEREFAI